MKRGVAVATLLLATGCATTPAAPPLGSAGERWHLHAAATASAALYGPPQSEARFAIRCEADRRRLVLVMVGAAPASRIGVRIGRAETMLPARFEEDGLPSLTAELASNAPLLTALAAAPRFEIAAGGAGYVALPGDPAIGQVIRSCRR